MICAIRGHYSGHVICIDQSEVSIQVKWSIWTNYRPVFRSRDQFRQIRGQYLGHVICPDQLEASIQDKNNQTSGKLSGT